MQYEFDRLVERRGTSSLKWDYSARFTGVSDLLPLWVADMDFPAPPEIVEALESRVRHGIFGYTVTPDSYFEAARDWLQRRNGWKVSREWMLPSPGVIPSLSAAILAFSAPGDSIVIQPPVYPPFAQRIASNGRRVVENPLVERDGRFAMDLDGLEAVLEERTRMLVLCSPHNPVGRVWSGEELSRLARVCASHDLIIVSDEIHRDIVMPGFHHVPFASVAEKGGPAVVTLVSSTKTFNLAGICGSLAIIPDPALRKRFSDAHKAILVDLGNALGLAAAEAAWRGCGEWLDQMIAYVEGNCRFLKDALARQLPQVTVIPLEGTYLAWMDFRGLGLSADEIKSRLQRQGGLWLEDGRQYGRGGEGFQRINLACPRARLEEAVARMARVFAR